MTDALVAFLKARLDDDERVARAATQGEWVWSREFVTPPGYHHRTVGPLEPGDAAHIARQDPARTLREVEAKRQLLDEHRPDGAGCCTTCAQPEDFDDDADGNRSFSRRPMPWPCPTVKLLAVPYSGHPEYEEALAGG